MNPQAGRNESSLPLPAAFVLALLLPLLLELLLLVGGERRRAWVAAAAGQDDQPAGDKEGRQPSHYSSFGLATLPSLRTQNRWKATGSGLNRTCRTDPSPITTLTPAGCEDPNWASPESRLSGVNGG